jgi:hypothetical protein
MDLKSKARAYVCINELCNPLKGHTERCDLRMEVIKNAMEFVQRETAKRCAEIAQEHYCKDIGLCAGHEGAVCNDGIEYEIKKEFGL